MKIFWICVFTLFTVVTSIAQSINYQKSFQNALTTAQLKNKLVFVFIGAPDMSQQRPNMPKMKPGIENEDVVNFYNKNFVNVKFTMSDTAYISFVKKYSLQINSYPSYFFFDSKGNMVSKGIPILATAPEFYTKMANDALKAASSDRSVSNYENLRKAGRLTLAQYKDYIVLRQELGLTNNAQLLDEYVNELPVKAFNDYQEVLFIMKAGPIAYGKAYTLCYTNRKLIDSIYKYEPLEVRKAINNRIIDNTRTEAVNSKSSTLAQQLSNFVRNSWSRDYARGARAAENEMIYYYYAVKDTANYFRQATYYFDRYYMHLSADSIKKLNVQAMESARKVNEERVKLLNPNAIFKTGPIKTNNLTNTKITQVMTSGGNIAGDVPTILNNVAYNFYLLGTQNPDYLTKAMLWSKRSIELNPNVFAFYDTLAHLLYRLGFYDEAVSQQKKAVELAHQGSTAASENNKLKKELNKIQQRNL